MRPVSAGRSAPLIAALGFFALAAQTLLFRDFLDVFEGSELAVGVFFAMWFLWIGVGALIGRATPRCAAWFPWLTLLYVPAFVLEHYLIFGARGLAGVAAYEIFPYKTLLAWSLLTNAPVSAATGWLFTLACPWWEGEQRSPLPVARVYVLETLGAALGGVAVTLLLWNHVSAQTIFLICGVVLSMAMTLASPRPRIQFIPVVLLIVAFCAGLGGSWARWDSAQRWGRLLPRESYHGSFSTAQAEYLYGQRENQFVVLSNGEVCETLPNAEHGGEVTALALSQCPKAKRVLLVGPDSLHIALQLLRIPQITDITWLDPDPRYPGELMRILPDAFSNEARRICMPPQDARAFLAEKTNEYDLVLLNLPDPSTLILSRYCSREFFELIAKAMTPAGVAALRVSGGANVLGGELAYQGASSFTTFHELFQFVSIKPGDESWLIGCREENLSELGATLRDRFAQIPGAAEVYPPEGLLSLYLPDRIAFQRGKYDEIKHKTDPDLLRNTDARPKALLFALLTTLRQAGMKKLAEHIPVILQIGAWMVIGAILIYLVLRLHARIGARKSQQIRFTSFDTAFLIFAVGCIAISLSLILFLNYQARFGALFLTIGLMSALFMLGSGLGGAGVQYLLAWEGEAPAEPSNKSVLCTKRHLGFLSYGSAGASPSRLLLLLGLVVLFVLSLLFYAQDVQNQLIYAGLFCMAGLATGAIFPLAAERLCAAQHTTIISGAMLETLDHLGAATGAIVTGLWLIPLFGANACLPILALLMIVSIGLCFKGYMVSTEGDKVDWFTRIGGYSLAGIGIFLILTADLAAWAYRSEEGLRLASTARILLDNATLEKRVAKLPDGSSTEYFVSPEGVSVFSSRPFTRGIRGYGGTIELALAMDQDGVLKKVQVMQSRETPAYLRMVEGWLASFQGKNLLDEKDFQSVDGVTGATLTSNAILETVQTAGRAFASAALGKEVKAMPEAPSRTRVDVNFWWLAGFFAVGVLARYWPNPWIRRGILLASVGVLGFWLNLQYSTQQLFSSLAFNGLPGLWTAPFFLVILLPVLALVFGNVYCGYVCPFGAAQELLGDLRPKYFATDPDKSVWRYARLVKYVLLFLLTALFAFTRDSAVLGADPLITFFSSARGGTVLILALIVLALSIFYRRFWCRNVCPAGAFLAVLKSVRILRKISPPTLPNRCDLGVRNTDELDCLHCDRCLHANK
ncbi:MAG TPA: 4Fe-4S binding protein [Candidatus Hydrogenedentes bacterium]|nr:4Fe-4S binding protein [Candidatus Hydrogenedentota bacterium]